MASESEDSLIQPCKQTSVKTPPIPCVAAKKREPAQSLAKPPSKVAKNNNRLKSDGTTKAPDVSKSAPQPIGNADEDVSDDDDDDDSLSGSVDDETSSESDESLVESETDCHRTATATSQSQHVDHADPPRDVAVADRTQTTPLFTKSPELVRELVRLESVLDKICNCEGSDMLPGNVYECVKDAQKLACALEPAATEMNLADANVLLCNTAHVAFRLAECLKSALNQAPPDVMTFHKTANNLHDVWTELLPDLDKFKTHTEAQAANAAHTARMASEIYGKHIGIISSVANAVNQMKW